MSCLCKANEKGWELAEVKGDRQGAIQVFEAALAENKRDTCCPEGAYDVVQTNLGCQYGDSGQIEKARVLWSKAAKTGNIDANYWMGCLLEKENNILAINHYRHAAIHAHPGALQFFRQRFPSLLPAIERESCRHRKRTTEKTSP